MGDGRQFQVSVKLDAQALRDRLNNMTGCEEVEVSFVLVDNSYIKPETHKLSIVNSTGQSYVYTSVIQDITVAHITTWLVDISGIVHVSNGIEIEADTREEAIEKATGDEGYELLTTTLEEELRDLEVSDITVIDVRSYTD